MKIEFYFKYLFTILFLLLLSERGFGYGDENVENIVTPSSYLSNGSGVEPDNITWIARSAKRGRALHRNILATNWGINFSDTVDFFNEIFRDIPLRPVPFTTTIPSANVGLESHPDPLPVVFNIVKADQTLTGFNDMSLTYGGTISDFPATTNSNLPLLYEIVEGESSNVISILNNQVTVLNAGTTKIRAFNNGNDFYNPFQKEITVTINIADQRFVGVSDLTKYVDDDNVVLREFTMNNSYITIPTKNQILYVSNDPSVVRVIKGNILDFLSEGTATITATSPNTDPNYNDLSPRTFNVTVNKRTQTITVNTIPTVTYPGPINNINATVNSVLGLQYEFVSGQLTDVVSLGINGELEVLNAGSTIIKVFNAGNDIFKPVAKELTINVNQAEQSVFAETSNIIGLLGDKVDRNLSVTDQNLPLQVNSDNEEIAFYNEEKIYLVGIGNMTIYYSQLGDRNYKPLIEKSFRIKVQNPDLLFCFDEDFFEVTSGNNIENNGSRRMWIGNNNFPTVATVYQAGEAVRLGNSSLSGFIESKVLSEISGNILVEIDVKGWTDVEGYLKVSLGGVEKQGIYTAKMEDNFETIRIPFENVASGSKLKIETSAKRAFIDGVRIICNTNVVPPTSPEIRVASKVTDNKFQANWSEVPGNKYLLDVYSKEIGNFTTDLLISEYVEGSANNRALEIYNGTGYTINLSAYKIKRQRNGYGEFTNAYTLPNTNLEHGQVCVIAHNFSIQALKDLANIITSTPVTFTGKEAIALTKEDKIIDQIGIFNSNTEWGVDKTLRRKPHVDVKEVYDYNDWDEYPINTFDGLGEHTTTIVDGVKRHYVLQNEQISVEDNFRNVNSNIEKNKDYYYTVKSKLGNIVSAPSEEMDVKRIYFENGFWTSDRQPEDEYHSVVLEGNFDGSLKGKSITIDNETTNTITSGNTFHAIHSFDVLSGAIVFDEGAYLLQDNDASVNYGEATFKRNATFFRYDSKVWSSPVNGQKIVKSSATDHTGFIFNPSKVFSYNEPTRNWLEDTDANFMTAKAYAIQLNKGYPNYSEGGTQVSFEGLFKGTPQNGVYTVPVKVSSDGRGDNGVGNPYGSPIAMENFMSVNQHVKALYFWNEEAHYDFSISGYNAQTWNAYNLTGNNNQTSTEIFFINTGVGFITRVTTDGDIIFNNSMREVPNTNSAIENRVKLEKDRFWLRLKENDKKLNQILIGYIPGATNEIDDKYDAKNLSMQGSYILSNTLGNKMIIEGRQYPLDNNDSIPLFFKASEVGQFTIYLALKEGIFNEENIYLRDNLENKIINLTEDNSYSFHSDKGDFPDRFMIQYKENQILNAVDLASANGITIYQNRTIYQVQSNELVNAYKVLNFNGDIIHKVNVGAENKFDLIALKSGVYFIQFSVQSGKVITKKMIIK
ncbi:MAG: lamin tail domain-containing protein [Flavobacteriaceae bacterium]|nr:lamin tail domain-containing protein [Candidatus Onthonaster equi]